MLRVLLLTTILYSLTGCGEGFHAKGIIDPDFRPFVIEFMQITGIHELNIDIYYNDLEGEVIGRCIIDGKNKDIQIDPKFWANAANISKKVYMFHELSHCILGQKHRDYRLDDNCPGSIMSPHYNGPSCYEKHYDYYIAELLNGGPL